MVIYFTGTGNSRYTAELTAELLDDRLIDSRQFIRDGIAGEFLSDKPCVFVCPVYAWRMPGVFADWLKSSSFGGVMEAYFLLTCGAEAGDSQRYIKEMCEELGLNYRGAAEVVMPDNYIVMFSAPTGEEIEKKLSRVPDRVAELCKYITDGKPFPEKRPSIIDKLKSGIVNTGFRQYYISSKKFYAGDACISCGKCAELCPTGAVMLKDGRPTWKEGCTHCMACISYCPTKAIEYGKTTRGKERYTCPKVK